MFALETRPRESVSFKVLRNSGSNVLRGLISLPIALVLTPIVVGALGIRDFGVWALVFVFVQSATLFDLGLSSGLIKFVAEYKERKEFSRLNRTFNSALLVYGLLGLGIAATLWLSKEFIVAGLFKAEATETYLYWALYLASATFSAQLVSSVFYSVLQGLQRIDLMNMVLVSAQIVHFGLVLGALWLGYGVVALVIVQGISVFAGGLAAALVVGRVCPELRLRVGEFDWSTIRQLLPLSLSMQGLSLQTLVFYQLDRIALSAFFGPAYAGYYDVAARPLTALRNVPLAVVQPIMPAVSELQARQDERRLRELFLLVSRFVILSAAPIFLLVVFLARPLLELWFANRPPDGLETIATNLRLLALTYVANLLGAPLSYVAAGLGAQRILLRYALIATITHVGLTFAGLYLLGPIGAPLGILLATVIAVSLYFRDFSKSTDLAAMSVLRTAWKPVGLAAGLGLVTWAVLSMIPISSPVLTVGAAFAYLGSYALGAWWTGIVTAEDMKLLQRFLPRFQNRLVPEIRDLSRRVAETALRIVRFPEQRLQAHVVKRFASREQSDQLTLRWAILWGWGLDRIRRNVVVAQKVREVQNGKRLRVLDVGCSDGGVYAFLPAELCDVYSVDLDFQKLLANGVRRHTVCADGCRLPFSDAVFDVVVSVDCLEHVPPSGRRDFLQELTRVAKSRVVLHFPARDSQQFQGSLFDAAFQRRYRLMFRRDKNIEEHLQNGLPDVREVEALFQGSKVAGRENGYLWTRYMLLERVPYLSFLTGLIFLPVRKQIDAPPHHAAMLVYDVPANEKEPDGAEAKEVACLIE